MSYSTACATPGMRSSSAHWRARSSGASGLPTRMTLEAVKAPGEDRPQRPSRSVGASAPGARVARLANPKSPVNVGLERRRRAAPHRATDNRAQTSGDSHVQARALGRVPGRRSRSLPAGSRMAPSGSSSHHGPPRPDGDGTRDGRPAPRSPPPVGRSRRHRCSSSREAPADERQRPHVQVFGRRAAWGVLAAEGTVSSFVGETHGRPATGNPRAQGSSGLA